ncbi:hypothetical protein J1N35_034745 [Gossypium stocksii]|uniref:Uncharacterized protein n=1 Tax=Gossypium stocksii TaxID=47602 RepID=A0A9D3ZR02_9ROSI|nr:hypothetical protein J1N35_034745 [Gossypium stocksii]
MKGYSMSLKHRVSSRCHVPEMVLHWLTCQVDAMSQTWFYTDSQRIEADAMSQTWSYTGSLLSVLMPCPKHGLTLTHIQAGAMSQTWSYTNTRINADAMSQTWSYIG